MHDLVTSYLIQKRECSLPHLGTFTMARTSPQLDVAGQVLSAPVDTVQFSEGSPYHSGGFAGYVSSMESTTAEAAEEQINSWCLGRKMDLDNQLDVRFEPLGFLARDAAGNIVFSQSATTPLFEPLTAERVVHKEDGHTVLVGDTEISSSDLSQQWQPAPVVAGRWRLAALILAIIALLLLVYFLRERSFTIAGVGRHTPVEATTPAPTYHETR